MGSFGVKRTLEKGLLHRGLLNLVLAVACNRFAVTCLPVLDICPVQNGSCSSKTQVKRSRRPRLVGQRFKLLSMAFEGAVRLKSGLLLENAAVKTTRIMLAVTAHSNAQKGDIVLNTAIFATR